jgi:hypothetical protein
MVDLFARLILSGVLTKVVILITNFLVAVALRVLAIVRLVLGIVQIVQIRAFLAVAVLAVLLIQVGALAKAILIKVFLVVLRVPAIFRRALVGVASILVIFRHVLVAPLTRTMGLMKAIFLLGQSIRLTRLRLRSLVSQSFRQLIRLLAPFGRRFRQAFLLARRLFLSQSVAWAIAMRFWIFLLILIKGFPTSRRQLNRRNFQKVVNILTRDFLVDVRLWQPSRGLLVL